MQPLKSIFNAFQNREYSGKREKQIDNFMTSGHYYEATTIRGHPVSSLGTESVVSSETVAAAAAKSSHVA